MNVMINSNRKRYLQSESVSSRKLLSISRKSRLISVLDKQCTPIVIINCIISVSSINDGCSGDDDGGDGDGDSGDASGGIVLLVVVMVLLVCKSSVYISI